MTAKQVERHERRQVALSLRMAGASYAEIVKAGIGYNSTAAVSQDIRKILHSFTYETPEDVLVLDLARLDEMQKIITAAFRTGDYGQAGMLLRIMQFRRETLGITPEVIANGRSTAQQMVNNGIMVVQGTAGDFLDGMMQAAGASEKERQRELEKVADSNVTSQKQSHQVIEGEVTTGPMRDAPYTSTSENTESEVVYEESTRFVNDFSDFAENREETDFQREAIPQLDLSSPILETDVPQDTPEKKRKLRIPAKPDDSNQNIASGISYRMPRRKLDEKSAQEVVRRKLIRSRGLSSQKSSAEDLVDELDSETTEESF